jgi:hypothetical protein
MIDVREPTQKNPSAFNLDKEQLSTNHFHHPWYIVWKFLPYEVC